MSNAVSDDANADSTPDNTTQQNGDEGVVEQFQSMDEVSEEDGEEEDTEGDYEDMEIGVQKSAQKRGLKESTIQRKKKVSKLQHGSKRSRSKIFRHIKPGSQVTKVNLPHNMKSTQYLNELGLSDKAIVTWADATDITVDPTPQLGNHDGGGGCPKAPTGTTE